MPKRKSQSESSPQNKERGSAPLRPGKHWSNAQGRRSLRNPWIKRSTVRVIGISAIVVVAVVALVIVGINESLGSDFEFSMYQGEEVLGGTDLTFSQLFPAEKPVVLNFWAGLCPPCRAEMPGFQSVYEQYSDDFIMLGLDVGPFMNLGSNRDARNLLRDLNITYPAGYAHNRDSVTQNRVISMPTTVFFTPDGKVFRRQEGFLDRQRMADTVQDLLQASTTLSRGTDRGPSSHGSG